MIEFTVLDYLGKYTEDNIYGIFVLLTLKYGDSITEAICFYNDNMIDLTVDQELEVLLNSKIEDYSEYKSLLYDIAKSLVPFTEMVNRIDNVDFDAYYKALNNGNVSSDEPEEIDPSEIKTDESN